jgi:predicted membrane chloride channel (bestrophin family)
MLGINFGALAARIGLQAAFGGLGRKLKAGGAWLGRQDAIHLLAIVLALVLVADHVALLLAHREGRKLQGQLATSAQALKDARGALAVSQANEVKLRGQLADQNARVQQLAQRTAVQQQAYAKARQQATGRVEAAQATAQRLAASAGHRPAPAAPCEPSDALKQAWH